MKPRNFIGEVESRYLSTLKVSTVSAPITIMSRGANSSYNLVMWWRHKLYNRKCTSSVCSKHFFKAQNDFINDFTALHKHSNLILALQLYIKRSYTTLYPEKISCKSICILDNRNIQITIRGQREKRGGNKLNCHWILCMYVCMSKKCFEQRWGLFESLFFKNCKIAKFHLHFLWNLRWLSSFHRLFFYRSQNEREKM